MRVGYQGVKGSYSYAAMMNYFSDEDYTMYNFGDFEDVFRAVENNKIEFGVLPIENSSTGSISAVYDLITKFEIAIVGETYVKVDHNLIGMKESSIENIDEIYSHQQGFDQSKDYLKDKKWKLVPFRNTAESVKKLGEDRVITQGAIGSKSAAEIYDMKILASNINDSENNHTKFIIISAKNIVDAKFNKISVMAIVNHTPGSLINMLHCFSEYEINLLKIESRPIRSRNWEYRFYIDFQGNLEDEKIIKAITHMKVNSSSFRVLGNYTAGKEGV